MPTGDDLAAWVAATGAGPDELVEPRELLTAACVEYATWRDVAREGAARPAARQGAYALSEARATRVVAYQPAMVPGIVQTAVYVETLTGEQRLHEPDETAVYLQAFEHLKQAAAHGRSARELIHRILSERWTRS